MGSPRPHGFPISHQFWHPGAAAGPLGTPSCLHERSTPGVVQRKPCGFAKHLHATENAFIIGFSGIRQIKAVFNLLMYQEVAVS